MLHKYKYWAKTNLKGDKINNILEHGFFSSSERTVTRNTVMTDLASNCFFFCFLSPAAKVSNRRYFLTDENIWYSYHDESTNEQIKIV